jgi:hypothetical protein
MSTRRPHEANPEFVNPTRSQWPGSERPGHSVLMWFREGWVVGLSSLGETAGVRVLLRRSLVVPAAAPPAWLGPRGGEQRGDVRFHVIVGAAVGAAVGGDRKDAAEAAAITPRPGEDAGNPVRTLLEPELLRNVLTTEALSWRVGE